VKLGYLLLVGFFAVGCSQKSVHENEITFDPGLMQDWTEERQNVEPCPLPFLAKYNRFNKKFNFIAANHGDGPYEKNPTFQLIKKTFEKYPPKFLIVETITSSLGVSPESIKREAAECERSEYKKCNERFFAINQAIKYNIPFIGAEPDGTIYIQGMSPKYTADDAAGYFWYMYVNRFRRRGQNDFRAAAEQEKTSQEIMGRIGHKMTYDQFEKWFLKTVGRPFSVKELDGDMLAPIKNSNNFLQRWSYDQDFLREPRILKIFETYLNKYGDVLAIYGGGHHVRDGKIFFEALGKPSAECR
jgi:hypothetical protein